MAAVPHDDFEPDNDMGLWEYQRHPLTVRWLKLALEGLPDDLAVDVELHDGADRRSLRPMHIDLKGEGDEPSAVVITVA